MSRLRSCLCCRPAVRPCGRWPASSRTRSTRKLKQHRPMSLFSAFRIASSSAIFSLISARFRCASRRVSLHRGSRSSAGKSPISRKERPDVWVRRSFTGMRTVASACCPGAAIAASSARTSRSSARQFSRDATAVHDAGLKSWASVSQLMTQDATFPPCPHRHRPYRVVVADRNRGRTNTCRAPRLPARNWHQAGRRAGSPRAR